MSFPDKTAAHYFKQDGFVRNDVDEETVDDDFFYHTFYDYQVDKLTTQRGNRLPHVPKDRRDRQGI